MKLTKAMKYALKLAYHGGGAWVEPSKPTYRTHTALLKRGLLATTTPRWEGGTEFVVTDEGKRIAKDLP